MNNNTYSFRERFKRWKNGERYWSIVGRPLPHYTTGKDNEDDEYVSISNPDIGYLLGEQYVTPKGNYYKTTSDGRPTISKETVKELHLPVYRENRQLKNNQPVYGETNRAANERADEYANRISPSALDIVSAGTLGGLNNLSPTQWARRAYDLGEVIKGNMPWSDYGNRFIQGNEGVVSADYAKEHPYKSMALNTIGDIAAFGAASALRKLPKYAALMRAENKAAQEAVAKNWQYLINNGVYNTDYGFYSPKSPALPWYQATNPAYYTNKFLFQYNTVNKILNRYGYKELDLTLPENKLRNELLDRVRQHGRFLRGIHPVDRKGELNQWRKNVSNAIGIPKDKLTTDQLFEWAATHRVGDTSHGRTGLETAFDVLGRRDNVGTNYASNSRVVASRYADAHFPKNHPKRGKIYQIELPIVNKAEKDPLKLWMDNEFTVLYKNKEYRTRWRAKELPLLAKTGIDYKEYVKEAANLHKNLLDEELSNNPFYSKPSSFALTKNAKNKEKHMLLSINQRLKEAGLDEMKVYRSNYGKLYNLYKNIINFPSDDIIQKYTSSVKASRNLSTNKPQLEPNLFTTKDLNNMTIFWPWFKNRLSDNQRDVFNKILSKKLSLEENIKYLPEITNRKQEYLNILKNHFKQDFRDFAQNANYYEILLPQFTENILLDKKIIQSVDDIMKQFKVLPDYNIKARGNNIIMTTEGIKEPINSTNPLLRRNLLQHYINIGEPGEQIGFNLKEVPIRGVNKNRSRKHDGPWYPGMSRNLGAILPFIFMPHLFSQPSHQDLLELD